MREPVIDGAPDLAAVDTNVRAVEGPAFGVITDSYKPDQVEAFIGGVDARLAESRTLTPEAQMQRLEQRAALEPFQQIKEPPSPELVRAEDFQKRVSNAIKGAEALNAQMDTLGPTAQSIAELAVKAGLPNPIEELMRKAGNPQRVETRIIEGLRAKAEEAKAVVDRERLAHGEREKAKQIAGVKNFERNLITASELLKENKPGFEAFTAGLSEAAKTRADDMITKHGSVVNGVLAEGFSKDKMSPEQTAALEKYLDTLNGVPSGDAAVKQNLMSALYQRAGINVADRVRGTQVANLALGHVILPPDLSKATGARTYGELVKSFMHKDNKKVTAVHIDSAIRSIKSTADQTPSILTTRHDLAVHLQRGIHSGNSTRVHSLREAAKVCEVDVRGEIRTDEFVQKAGVYVRKGEFTSTQFNREIPTREKAERDDLLAKKAEVYARHEAEAAERAKQKVESEKEKEVVERLANKFQRHFQALHKETHLNSYDKFKRVKLYEKLYTEKYLRIPNNEKEYNRLRDKKLSSLYQSMTYDEAKAFQDSALKRREAILDQMYANEGVTRTEKFKNVRFTENAVSDKLKAINEERMSEKARPIDIVTLGREGQVDPVANVLSGKIRGVDSRPGEEYDPYDIEDMIRKGKAERDAEMQAEFDRVYERLAGARRKEDPNNPGRTYESNLFTGIKTQEDNEAAKQKAESKERRRLWIEYKQKQAKDFFKGIGDRIASGWKLPELQQLSPEDQRRLQAAANLLPVQSQAILAAAEAADDLEAEESAATARRVIKPRIGGAQARRGRRRVA